MLSSSEFVSSGHPDRLADNIAAIIIQDIQHKDKELSHAAVEVFLTHDTAIIGGEVKTILQLDEKYLRNVLNKAFLMSGYLPKMREYWTRDEVALADDFKIINAISAQSPDIALGTTDLGDESGWNDQGVYFSSADNTNKTYQGQPHYVAQLISNHLHSLSKDTILNNGDRLGGIVIGPDNKCVVTYRVEKNGITPIEVSAITIAVPHTSRDDPERVRRYIKETVTTLLHGHLIVIADDCKWIINGTGRFVIHGPISDTSMSGRKISVNHPSAGPLWSNKMIGGGSMIKPAHASDLILNIMARFIANVVVAAGLSKFAIVGLSGAIGQKGIQSMFISGDENWQANVWHRRTSTLNYFRDTVTWSPIAIAKKFGFFSDDFDFAEIVNHNFFGNGEIQPWENKTLIQQVAKDLMYYITNCKYDGE